MVVIIRENTCKKGASVGVYYLPYVKFLLTQLKLWSYLRPKHVANMDNHQMTLSFYGVLE